ncbi:hypothetical protein [Cellulomonas sp. S1-8]|uniref:hypothetical protein n=1 Tax=Cellulomonas sp. S1-8 TaxID=2904790 RepID=UPI002242FDBE|nr:hypothetical protein [Cellulomonas sp. S1-8]UZN02071.1 hypothetical protein OKX07_13370 [Cellulomonas sp. S1-8]
MTRRRSLYVLAVLVLCGACSPAGAPSDAPTVADEAGDVVAMSPQSPRSGPLVELMGLARDVSSPTYVEDLVVQFREREDRTSACMAEQGFEYEPVALEPEDITLVGADVPLPGTRAFVEQHGYGVADDTSPPGSYTWTLEPPGWESMSGAAREAYMIALDGMTADGTPVGDTLGPDGLPVPDGCQHRAMRGAVDDASAALTEEALDHLDAMPDDGSVDELDGSWSRCMADQGYAYASPTAARAALVDTWNELLGETGADMDDEESATAREHEMRVAAADLECQLETDYLARWTDLGRDYQQQFIDTHQGEIDAWLEARG